MKILFQTSLRIIVIVTIFMSSIGCKKFLEKKPRSILATVDEVRKAQALLDDHRLINDNMPSLGMASSDDYFLKESEINSSTSFDRQIYIWAKSGIHRPTTNEWTALYNNIYKCNVVLWSLDQLDRKQEDDSSWNATKGHALFLRSLYFFEGAQIWCNAYDEVSSSIDMGLPLRSDPDFEVRSVRATIKETYTQIIKDLKTSVSLLPIVPAHVVRPSKPAAFALLARTYLAMRQYDSAGHYASLVLNFRNNLFDYNNVSAPGSAFPFGPKYSHPEIIFDLAIGGPPATLNANRSKIDSLLYREYHPDDLRRNLYFTVDPEGTVRFKGSLVGSVVLFTGMTVGEMTLIKAECEARLGSEPAVAIETLNGLLARRFKTGTFTPLAFENRQQALNAILLERRKELLMRGQRWSDIKRLNKEGYNITPTRIVNGELITLHPNHSSYARPIPDEVIFYSDVLQNP